MSSLNQENQVFSGALTGESQQGNKMMRYVNEPKSFSGYTKYPGGDICTEAYTWLNRMSRLKATAKLSDKEILFIVGDHLVEKAETWWNVVGSKSESWKEFSELFKKQYMVDQEDKWWRQLQTMKQGPQDSIDDVALKMEELFGLLGSMSDAFQVRTFLGAVNPAIAFEVEKDETPNTFSAAKKKAKQIERSLAKYGANGVMGTRGFSNGTIVENDNVGSQHGWNSSSSTVSSLAERLEQLRINLVQLSNVVMGQERVAPQVVNPKPVRRGLVCFFCDEEGHRKFECPKFLENQNGGAINQTPATGSNAIPVNQGKGLERHGDGLAEVYVSKRRMDTPPSVSASDAHVDKRPVAGTGQVYSGLQQATSSSQPFGAGVPVVVGAPVGGGVPSNTQMGTLPGLQGGPTVKRVVKKRTRGKARRLPVKIKKKGNVWEVLDGTNAGLSVAGLIAMDRGIQRDVIDGIRFLREKQASLRSNEKVATKGRRIEENSSAVPMVINVVDQDGYGSDSSIVSGDDLVSNDDSDWQSTFSLSDGSNDSVNFSEDWDDGVSVYHYPYSLNQMKQGSPLKGVVNINGKSVVAIFDTGASVSVIGKALAASLGLRPNGDTLALTGLENKQGDDSPIGYTSHIKDRSLLNSKVMLPSVLDASASIKATVGSDDDRRVYMVQNSQNHVDAYEDVLIPDGEALEEEFKYNADNITIGVLPELADVVEKYKECFSEVSGLGRVTGYKMDLPLVDGATPIRTKPFRISWQEEEVLDQYLQEMLDLNIIKPSNGLWASPCFFIPKKDGSLRLVIDYRKLNKMVKQDAYPLPHIDELLDSVGGATIFSTLDCTSGYHQLPLNEEHAERTGFVTKRGTFSFNVLPFGITTGCSQYQRMMHSILSKYVGDFVLIFLDDILVYSKSVEEHRYHLSLLLEACAKANLKLKRKKCKFGESQVEYLGHVITADGVLPSDHNINKVKMFETPAGVDDVRSFLGLTGYYRKYVPGYATMAEPLTRLLKKTVPFSWGPDQQSSFDQFIKALTQTPILSYPDRKKIQVLSVDASLKGLGAILSQVVVHLRL
ncbi:hypothetical protein RO3G_07695 [Rhizopus delemar RA 99-880]|uniref:Reverse transcriptase domain-containing protein n=1 Tax=Rhizopus delemar (strain RA 99-880 / ATCC MYA-4621 / FGSC 9543 / NRRL 43880) TaxID=246409 RepID=I1C3G0_RHIO9|nr:hypothetical protein RO3G_07695 [Rhizopus delemar RA 99-880]|eukprot:EIE82990.1 hypothetical protein RO3G_07695 [Rhizopus delemar RA 99-880]